MRCFRGPVGFECYFSRCTVRPRDSTTDETYEILTGHEWYGLQLLLPLRAHENLVIVLALICDCISNREGMLNHLLDVVGSYCVEHVEGVLAVGLAALGVVVGKVDQDLGVLPNEGPDLLDRDLIELGNVDRPQHRHLEELLRICKHQFEEILIDHTWRRNIELHYRVNGHWGSVTYDTLRSSG